MQNDKLTKLGSKGTEYIDKYNPSLLEEILRAPRRTGYTASMNGWDVWTAYEFTYLNENGLPDYCILRIYNPASSERIFESKSLKLYLNSFSNTKFKNRGTAIQTVEDDLTKFVGSKVKVLEIDRFDNCDYSNMICLEKVCRDSEIDVYNYKKELLVSYEGNSGQVERFYSNLLRSNCEQTKQPDSACIFITYKVNKKRVDVESLLKYIVSYRNKQEFHEPACERIYNDLYELLNPLELTVLCQYTRRGGIDINPIRSTTDIFNTLPNLPKLIQQ